VKLQACTHAIEEDSMSSWKLISGVLVVSAATAVMSGCPTEMPSRPDAAFGTDTGITLVDAFVPPGTDTGVTPPDAAMTTSMCTSSMGMCDLRLQNCPMVMGVPQACVYALPTEMATTPETVCAGIVDAGGGAGDPCCALNSCDAGYVCDGAVQAGGTCSTMGTCQRYCCGPTDCNAGQLCSRFSSGTFTGGICTDIDNCDLVAQTGCAMGEACYPAMGAATQCSTPIAPAVAVGGACMFTNSCVRGSACFGITPAGGMRRDICLAFCSLTGPSTCPPPAGSMTPAPCQASTAVPAGVGICPPPA
jgi:hypothetical protein